MCCVFRPAFGCWAHPKAGRTTFFQPFQRTPSESTSFFVLFQMFFVDFRHEITEKGLKWAKKGWKRLKRVVRPAFGCAQHPKAGQNLQQSCKEAWYVQQNITLCTRLSGCLSVTELHFVLKKKCTNLKFVILSANSNGNCAPDARFCRIKVIQGQDMLQFVVVYGRHQWKIFSVARCEITEFLKDRNWNKTLKYFFSTWFDGGLITSLFFNVGLICFQIFMQLIHRKFVL